MWAVTSVRKVWAASRCVAACSDYRSGPKLPPRVKIDALIRDRAVNNGTRPRRMANGQASPK
ncbi:hypothetical protein HaLaN_26777, partial [Haematococcus lacustris]